MNTDDLDQASEEPGGAHAEQSLPGRNFDSLPIIGLGGSAGSIGALQRFFQIAPHDAGVAYVVVVHLASDHESKLASLLQNTTRMPVRQVTATQEVEPNTVFVIPPAYSLATRDGHLQLLPLPPKPGPRLTVDLFFRSLADTHGPNATAIVLSGMDGDGALGIKRIKELGGLTIAQDPEEAEFADMPRNAIATGMVDWVLKVEEMPERLAAFRRHGARMRLPPNASPQPAVAPPVSNAGAEDALRDVLAFLRARTGRDFSYYKRSTILRRVARRMQVNMVDDLPSYLAYLRTQPGEAGVLLQDLLISVTNFFRDAETFDILQQHIPALFEGKRPGDTVRVWVPACATGEEAYSIAMLLHEYARTLDTSPGIQVFGTDLDEQAIQVARNGVYPSIIAGDVSPERLRRFFVNTPQGYRVQRELRDSVLFAPHDLLTDPPFSRLDLVSCRNLLIYLSRDAQQRALDIFHFALLTGGILLLGASETVDDSSSYFSVLNKTHRLYAPRNVPRTALPALNGQGRLALALDRQPGARDHFLLPLGPLPTSPAEDKTAWPAAAKSATSHTDSWVDLHYRLLERLAPPSVLVNQQHDLLHLSEHAGRFLQFSGGELSRNLLHTVHPALRIDLRAALYRAEKSGMPTEVEEIPIQLNGEACLVAIRVVPAADLAPDFLLVTFSERPAHSDAQAPEPPVPHEPLVVQMEREVEALRAQLRDVVEHAETSTEEHKASNEELQAMNEELRSATEELESSREELQSVNEELITVNHELKNNVEQLAHANSDLVNLIAATSIATVFLDRELRIMRYTPTAVALFNLIPTDIGRPLSDLAGRLDHMQLDRDASRVLEQLVPSEREVQADGRWFLARTLPYRTSDDHIAGVVLCFVDISERRHAELALATSSEQLRLIVANAREYAIVSTDLQRRVTIWNPGAERLLGHTEAEIIGQPADLIFTPEDRAAGQPALEAAEALRHGRASDERWHQRRDGSRFWGSGVMMAMNDRDGKAIGLVKIFRDQTENRLAMQALEQSRAEVEAASLAKDRFLAVLSHELRTPLTPVLMAVDALSARADMPATSLPILEMVRRNIKTQAHMIDELLDVTRISRGKLEISPAPMDLHQAVHAAIEVCEPQMRDRKQKLQVALDARDTQISGDFNRLRQAFWNILQNASKFTPRDGHISIASRNESGRIVLSFTDDGMGIAPKILPAIFDAFAQGSEEITHEYGGLGLGLAIVQATVHAHGGQLSANSDGEGKGTTISIELPQPEAALL